MSSSFHTRGNLSDQKNHTKPSNRTFSASNGTVPSMQAPAPREKARTPAASSLRTRSVTAPDDSNCATPTEFMLAIPVVPSSLASMPQTAVSTGSSFVVPPQTGPPKTTSKPPTMSASTQPKYNDCLPCAKGRHHLVCGHWIGSQEPCGVNCKFGDLNAAPFACLVCREIVTDVLREKLTKHEIERLKRMEGISQMHRIAYVVECVTRHAPAVRANVSETVCAMLLKNVSRMCEAAGPLVPGKIPSFDDTIRELEKQHEQNERHRTALDSSLKRKAGQKVNQNTKADSKSTKDDKVSSNNPAKTTFEQDTNFAVPTSKTQSSAKKQKYKLESDREPINSDNRGTKRGLAVDNGHLSPTKRPKHRISPLPDNITPDVQGTKRPMPPPYIFTGSKRPCLAPLGPAMLSPRLARKWNANAHASPTPQEYILHYADGIEINSPSGSCKRRRTSTWFSDSSSNDVRFAIPF